MARDSDGAGQSKRPPLNHHVSHDSDSQASDHTSTHSAHHRLKPLTHTHKQHVVGAGRLHSRVPSSKALQHKPHHHSKTNITTAAHRRHPSPSPERPPERPPMLSAAHRRTTSDVRLSRDSSTSNLRKNTSHSNLHLKRNRSHVEVAKRTRSAASAAVAPAPRRSSSHKDVTKLKGTKGTVHFDLGTDGADNDVGTDGHEDEWVDASASASPYLSRRGSVASGSVASSSAQAPGKPDERSDGGDNPNPSPPDVKDTPDRERAQHKEYLTSRLLRRTPSQGAPPKMTTDTAVVQPRSVSPDSGLSRASSTLYDSPRTNHALPAPVGAGSASNNNADELTSRFVSGPGSAVNPETGSFYSPTHTMARTKRPKSLASLHRENRNSLTDDPEDEDESALAPRNRRSAYKAAPAEKSRTQQKLNLQRASSTIEPVPAGGGVGAVGASPLLGGAAYDNRDPRIGKLIERTGQEYLVVRRYQNPISRSIARLQRLPGADKNQHIPKANGTNGSIGKRASELGSTRHGLSSSLGDPHKSRPQTPRRDGSVRTSRVNSIYETDDDRAHSGGSYVGGEAEGVAALLRNLWDKGMELSASQD